MKLSSERGAVLILTFMVLIALTSIVTVYLYTTAMVAKSAGFGEVDDQALWLAEAGFQRALWQLATDSGFRMTPTNLSENVGAGSYSVTTSRSNATYTVASTGTVGPVSRKITQSVIATPNAFDYALFGNTNAATLKLENSVSVSGDVYYDGNVEVTADASVTNGLVYADSVTGAGTYTAAPGPPSPVPTYPLFNTTSYDSQITIAEAQTTADLTVQGTDTHNIGSGTVYYKKVTVKDSGKLMGTGILVATGDVVIENSATVSSDLTIITKMKVTMKNTASIGGIDLVYARDGVLMDDSASMSAGNILVPTTNKEVEMKNNTVMTGAIYTSKAKLQDSAVITGSIVANQFTSDKITNSARITYSESVLGSIPTGMESAPVTLRPQKDWAEVAP